MFTLDGYKELLESFLLSQYKFRLFGDDWNEKGCVYLRHDIDFCVDYALPIALIENELGINSTFFVLINSPLYNLFDAKNIGTLAEINGMGHKICLHVDEETINCREDFTRQMNSFFSLLPFADTKYVSRHRPNLRSKVLWLPENCVDVYGDLFFEQIEYASDSRGEWRFGYPTSRTAFLEKKSFQLLTHPLWWVHNETISSGEKVQKLLKKISEQDIKSLSFLKF